MHPDPDPMKRRLLKRESHVKADKLLFKNEFNVRSSLKEPVVMAMLKSVSRLFSALNN